MSLTAPTDGATISARQLVVFGTVDPPGAVVKVAGAPTRVANSTFRRRLSLGWGMHAIRVEAMAPGYLPTSVRVLVHNEPFRVTAVKRRGKHAGPATPRFVRHANAACASVPAANLNGAWSDARNFAGTHRESGPLQRLIASSGRLLARLRRIHVPSADAPAYAAFVASYQATIDGLAATLNDAAQQPSKLATDISQLSSTFRAAEQQGFALGLDVCTNGRLAY